MTIDNYWVNHSGTVLDRSRHVGSCF